MTRSLYDGDDLLMELDGAGNPVREYTHIPGVDRRHAVRMGGQTYYYTIEAPGHVAGLICPGGAMTHWSRRRRVPASRCATARASTTS